jgi:SAM-dependent methyltransferase
MIVVTENSESLFKNDDKEEILTESKDYEYKTCSNTFQFVRSLPSGLIFLKQRPVNEEMGVIYPTSYEPYQFNQLPKLVRVARDFVQRNKIKVLKTYVLDQGKILDLGCGNGTLLQLAKKFGPSSWELHANDLSDEMMSKLNQMGFKTHSCRAEDIQLRDYFDAIILNQVIEHFSDVHTLMKTCERLLKPSGVLIIETPSTDGLDAKIFKNKYWGGYHTPRHFYLFNENLLIRLAQDYKFSVANISYLASPAFWVQSVHHLLQENGYKKLSSFFKVKNLLAVAFFTFFDMIRIFLGFRTSNIRVVIRKTQNDAHS